MIDAGLAYLQWTNVWKDVYHRGVRTLKLPLDIWNYQELIFEHNLHWAVRPEFGPGPLEAVVEYVAQNPNRPSADAAREAKFGCIVPNQTSEC